MDKTKYIKNITSDINNYTPKELGYYFPAEFYPHKATWLSWPHRESSWPGKIVKIYQPYSKFIAEVSKGELVNINVVNLEMKDFALKYLKQTDANFEHINFYIHPTNDAWCRDHGPAFLINPLAKDYKKVIVNWEFNAWGSKYPPFDLDNRIPLLIANELKLPVFNPKIIMEGGSVDFNGKGTVITSKSCLLNKNRNPNLSQEQIENYLMDFYGVEQVLWVNDGIVGDDTDGHIDDTVRFVNEDTVLTVTETDPNDENYELLQTNLEQLKNMKLIGGKPLNVIELPMPKPVIYDGIRLPASYANFYIANEVVIVPIFNCDNDEIALNIIQKCFKDRKVIGIDSTEIVWGLGSFHCLSQQEPAI
ncbi:agmatine deiminase family protein [Apibacter muscae]|uniref:agmatine deiminase family protein n=1 Tax=Apibacter muscae TaxID=2509004 RepID=UPI0011AD3316|nr:agmatine deiminase family protein [Apibacter muscae]TWP22918.1 agmatine deiminase family protein [Apibacter muscae]